MESILSTFVQLPTRTRAQIGAVGTALGARKTAEALPGSLRPVLIAEFGSALNALPAIAVVGGVLGQLALPFVASRIAVVLLATLGSALIALAEIHATSLALMAASVVPLLAFCADRCKTAVYSATKKDRRRVARRMVRAENVAYGAIIGGYGLAILLLGWRATLIGLGALLVLVAVAAWFLVPAAPSSDGARGSLRSFGAVTRDRAFRFFAITNWGTKCAVVTVRLALPLALALEIGPEPAAALVGIIEVLTQFAGVRLDDHLHGRWSRGGTGGARVQRYAPDAMIAAGALATLGMLALARTTVLAPSLSPWVVIALFVLAALLVQVGRIMNNALTEERIISAHDSHVGPRKAVDGILRTIAQLPGAVLLLVVNPQGDGTGVRAAVVALVVTTVVSSALAVAGRRTVARRDGEPEA